jgi:hypothetical protein
MIVTPAVFKQFGQKALKQYFAGKNKDDDENTGISH